MKTKQPNIIFYLSDQQRWDTMGCYGQKLDVTPVLDKLAAEGTLFENAFTCQPVCAPVRASIQTGKYATETGVYMNCIPMRPDEVTIAKILTQAGYDTAYIGKWHLGGDVSYEAQISSTPLELRGGYDYWMASQTLEFTSHGYNGFVHDKDGNKHEFIGYRADCITNYAIDYLRNHDGERPFFMFVSPIEPHHQNDTKNYEGPDGSKELFKNFEVPGDLIGAVGDYNEQYPDYLGCCKSLDDNVGRLFNTLRDKGFDDNTIFIYTSDHGSHFRTRNFEYKRSCHDSCSRIPMIIWGPGFMGGNVVKELTSIIDLPATLLDCAGTDVPKEFQGKPLAPKINNPDAVWDDSIFMQISETQVGRCIRTKKWKYSVGADNVFKVFSAEAAFSKVYYEEFLYDLENDPHERNNLVESEEHAGVRGELKTKLLEYIAKSGEAEPEILPCKKQ